jgi:hypothetical protein
MDKMSSSRKSATFDQQSAARMALPNCLVERLILVYLNVVGGWCAALKSDISMESVVSMDKEGVEEEVEEGTEGDGVGVVGGAAGELRRVREQGVDSADLEPRFADLAAVDRILAVLSQSPLGSWVLQKRAPTLTIATHVRLLTDSALHYIIFLFASCLYHPD